MHVFVGEGLTAFRNQFASTFRRLHSDIEDPYFTALTLLPDENNGFTAKFSPDEQGNLSDSVEIANENLPIGLINFFEDLYTRKVTVVHQGNRSMVVVVWMRMFSNDWWDNVTLGMLVDSINSCRSNIRVEIAGFTDDAVSCFIPDSTKRLSPAEYKASFEKSLADVRRLRSFLQAVRLISNRNMDDVALNFDKDSLARVCAEYSAIMCRHYLDLNRAVSDPELPFESFGLSSINFSLKYYQDYIRNKVIIDEIGRQGVDKRRFNINALAQSTNPVLQEIVGEIRDFYNRNATHAKAKLALKGGVSPAGVVAAIDRELDEIIERLRERINTLVHSGDISVFESEALLALILGDDCSMFDVSAIDAGEIIIDDIIDEASQFFVTLDVENAKLQQVTQKEIKGIRNRMRNIASANREREHRLEAIEGNRREAQAVMRHIKGDEYRFGNVEYKVDLQIDSEPLEETYRPHPVMAESIDLRELFAPIRDQGSQGSCSAFAIASVIEALRRDGKRRSPAFMYWNARAAENRTSDDCGASLYGVLKPGVEKGVCTDEMMPYNPEVFNMAPSEAAFADALDCKVIEAKNVGLDLDAIKSALTDGFPVIVAVRIFDSFADTRSGFVPHPTAEEIAGNGRSDGHGRHAMVVCGFSDKERVFVVRNSWGLDFGEKGYCYIPYSYAQQFFLQACIVERVTPAAGSVYTDIAKTLDFNMKDANIEAAILQNLIAEDNAELAELAEESARLRTAWSHNVGVLGNVNNQKTFIREEQERFNESIKSEREIIDVLQSTKNEKLKAFRREYYKMMAWAVGITLLCWFVVLELPTFALPWIFAGVASVITVAIFSRCWWAYRVRRQELIDEIQRHSYQVDRLESEKRSIDIRGHIQGKMLREVGEYRLKLISRAQKLKAFNAALVQLYDEKVREIAGMNPEEPYPFLSILENRLLDKYYDSRKDAIDEVVDIKSLFEKYTVDDDIYKLFIDNAGFENAITEGLQGFTMREYLVRSNPGRWTFLPETAGLADVLPVLDSRAVPFCPYNSLLENAVEKYIFVKDICQADMATLQRYFSFTPMPVAVGDAYSISILNVVRYNLPDDCKA